MTKLKTDQIEELWRLDRLAATLFLTLWLTVSVTAAAGDIDPTFGQGGIVLDASISPPFHEEPFAIRVQPDGKILVSGQIWEDIAGDLYVKSFFIARYHPNGRLDTSFGTNGKIIGPISWEGEHVGQDIVLQPDGKIIAVGYRNYPFADFAINRYTSDGTLDPSFGSGGRTVTSMGGEFNFPVRAALQIDGRIIVAGYSYFRPTNEFAFSVARYQPNGLLDMSFGDAGKVITVVGQNYAQIGAVLIQEDKKVVIVGSSGDANDFTLVRYAADGTLDPTFGVNGIVKHRLFGPAQFYHGALQPDGRILGAGYSNGRSVIIRYKSDGSIDTNFAVNGVFQFEHGFHVGENLALQPNGKIVVFGYGGTGGFAIARLTSDGSLDTDFGINGSVVTLIAPYIFSAAAVGALQPDGKLLAFGVAYIDNYSWDTAIVRYHGDAVRPPAVLFDFDGDARSDISIFRPSDGTWYLDRTSSGFTASQFGISTDQIAPADLDGDGKTDIAVYRRGTWYWLNSSNGNFHALQFGLAGDVPIPADYTGDGRAELAIYRDGTWWTYDVSNGQTHAVQFGTSGDRVLPADHDGDGNADLAVFRPSNGYWYILHSSDNEVRADAFGASGDVPLKGDFNGDGLADLAVFRPSNGTWYIARPTGIPSQNFDAIQFGISTDIPVPADYDGDGETDVAVYRDGIWYLRQSLSGFSAVSFGSVGDLPVPSAFIP